MCYFFLVLKIFVGLSLLHLWFHIWSSPLSCVGTRAFSNMTSGLAKLNPMASLRMKRASHPTVHPAASTFYFQVICLRMKKFETVITFDLESIVEPKCFFLYVKPFPFHFLHLQKPTVSVQNGSDVMIQMGGNETYLASCGVLASSLMAPPSPPPRYPSPPIARCHSDSAILHGSILGRSSIPGVSANRSPTPEILVSGTGDKNNTPAITPTLGGLSPSLLMQRVRKISHSSDEVDVRDERDAGVLRASSATNLQLHLPSSHSEGHIGGTSTQSAALNAGDHSNPLSPLSALNKEAVLAPFSVLARGVQSLAPGAGRLARGMQSIGANFDPRRLRAQRQRQLEDDPVLTEKKQNCKTRIIQL